MPHKFWIARVFPLCKQKLRFSYFTMINLAHNLVIYHQEKQRLFYEGKIFLGQFFHFLTHSTILVGLLELYETELITLTGHLHLIDGKKKALKNIPKR